MKDLRPDAGSQIRWFAYTLLLVTAVGGMIGRVWTVESSSRKSPLLGANDRSRWATIRAVVDHGTFALDDVIFRDRARTKRDRDWYSIDMVRHRGPDGVEHFYSSKPPLPTLLMAIPYWCLEKLTGATLEDRPFYVVRCLLLVANVLPLAVYFWLLFRLIERYGRTDWGRLFVAAGAAYGTFLTTFAVTLNNHVWAAVCAAAALAATLAIWCEGRRELRYFAAAGLFSAFTVANELPALSFCAVVGAALAYRSLGRFLAGFAPAAALVTAAFYLTNYWAHGQWLPPYAHRGDGRQLAALDGNYLAQVQAGKVPRELQTPLAEAGVQLSSAAVVLPRWSGQGWMIWDPTTQERLAVRADERSLRCLAWNQWYEYEQSYWLESRKAGVDRGEPSRAAYAFHVVMGHHGVFSLTPIWLLSVLGAGLWLARGEPRLRTVAAGILLVSLVCLAFYLARPLEDRNYGGVACGFRWMFWFAPLWLLAMLPAADAMAARPVWRYLALALLLLSAISAAYASLNPWSHPWLYDYWNSLGWLK